MQQNGDFQDEAGGENLKNEFLMADKQATTEAANEYTKIDDLSKEKYPWIGKDISPDVLSMMHSIRIVTRSWNRKQSSSSITTRSGATSGYL